jgi:tetratricopeptide (TPR) repeat protein
MRCCLQHKSVRLCLFAALVFFGLSACLSAPQSRLLQEQPPAGLSSPVLLTDVGFFPQEAYQCGPAALATVLDYSQQQVTADELVSQVYIPARQGSLQIEMLATARRYNRLPYVLPASLDSMLQEVAAGLPVLVMQNLGLSRWPQWHYAVVVGFDLTDGTLTLRSGTRSDYVISMAVFERTWARAAHWAVVILPPGQMPLDDNPTRYFQVLADAEPSLREESMTTAWRAGVQRWPASDLLSLGLSNHLYGQGLVQDAASVLAQLLAVDASSAAAHNNLAWLMLELGQTEEAIRLANQAVMRDRSFTQSLEDIHSKISRGK